MKRLFAAPLALVMLSVMGILAHADMIGPSLAETLSKPPFMRLCIVFAVALALMVLVVLKLIKKKKNASSKKDTKEDSSEH